jgi:hypothetical protein
LTSGCNVVTSVGGGDSQLAQDLDRSQFLRDERLASQFDRRGLAKSVELQIGLQPMSPIPHAASEVAIAGDPEAVRVDHHHIDRLPAGVFENLVEGRVQGRLAAGKLQHFGPTFDLHQPVDRPLDLFEGEMTASRSARGVAHRAVEIAARSNFDQADACVLLVLGAQAAVERAAAVGARAELLGHASGQTELELIVLRHVGTDKILANAVGRAVFAKIDPTPPLENLGRHQRVTIRAQTLGHSEEGVIAKCHARTPQSRLVGSKRPMRRELHRTENQQSDDARTGSATSIPIASAAPLNKSVIVSPQPTAPSDASRRCLFTYTASRAGTMIIVYKIARPGASNEIPHPIRMSASARIASDALSTDASVRGRSTRPSSDQPRVATKTFSLGAAGTAACVLKDRSHIQHLRDVREHSAPQSGQLRRIASAPHCGQMRKFREHSAPHSGQVRRFE